MRASARQMTRLRAAAGLRNGKDNAHRKQPSVLAGENSKSLIGPSSAKLKLNSLAVGSLIQTLQPFIMASENPSLCCRVKERQGERTQESASRASRSEQQEPDQAIQRQAQAGQDGLSEAEHTAIREEAQHRSCHQIQHGKCC